MLTMSFLAAIGRRHVNSTTRRLWCVVQGRVEVTNQANLAQYTTLLLSLAPRMTMRSEEYTFKQRRAGLFQASWLDLKSQLCRVIIGTNVIFAMFLKVF